jgi:hypothetical protein
MERQQSFVQLVGRRFPHLKTQIQPSRLTVAMPSLAQVSFSNQYYTMSIIIQNFDFPNSFCLFVCCGCCGCCFK